MVNKLMIVMVLLVFLFGLGMIITGVYHLDYLFMIVGLGLIIASYLIKREFNLYLLFWKE